MRVHATDTEGRRMTALGKIAAVCNFCSIHIGVLYLRAVANATKAGLEPLATYAVSQLCLVITAYVDVFPICLYSNQLVSDQWQRDVYKVLSGLFHLQWSRHLRCKRYERFHFAISPRFSLLLAGNCKCDTGFKGESCNSCGNWMCRNQKPPALTPSLSLLSAQKRVITIIRAAPRAQRRVHAMGAASARSMAPASARMEPKAPIVKAVLGPLFCCFTPRRNNFRLLFSGFAVLDFSISFQ